VREFGLEINFHACLSTITMLKSSRLLKSIPPKTLGVESLSQENQCIPCEFDEL